MKALYIRWLIAGIGALLLMSSFTAYLILRDRQKIDALFAAYRTQIASLHQTQIRERKLLQDTSQFPIPDASIPNIPVSDTILRNLRITRAELRLQSENSLAAIQNQVRTSDNKKLLWVLLMGLAGLIGLVIIFIGTRRISS